MLLVRGLCVLVLLAKLAQPKADLDSFSDQGYSVDPLLFSSDDLSGSQFLADDNVVSDYSAFVDPSINDDTTSLFAESRGDCSSDGDFRPSRKIRARDNPSCSAGSGSPNSPPVQLPNLDDIEKIANPVTEPSKTDGVQHKGLGYFPICPGSMRVPNWVVCGIQGVSDGLATWEYSLIDAELFFFGLTKCQSPRHVWCCESYDAEKRTASFCQLYSDLIKGPFRDGFFKG